MAIIPNQTLQSQLFQYRLIPQRSHAVPRKKPLCLCLHRCAFLPCTQQDRDTCLGCGCEMWTRTGIHMLITMMRNVILFIPCVVLLNTLFGLYGTISAQPVTETLLAVICLVMYLRSSRKDQVAVTVPKG